MTSVRANEITQRSGPGAADVAGHEGPDNERGEVAPQERSDATLPEQDGGRD